MDMNIKRLTIMALVLVLIAGLALVAQWHRDDRESGTAGDASDGGADGLIVTDPEGSVGVELIPGDDGVTPELLDSLTTAVAQIIRGDGSKVDMRSIDGEFDYLLVEPNEHLRIRVALKNADDAAPVRIEADNGGSLNRRVGPIVMTPNPGHRSVEFDYSVGGNTGRYTLLISQGRRQERMEFRAGPEPPLGKPGPQRIFNPQTT
jgi:hypothetical protein